MAMVSVRAELPQGNTDAKKLASFTFLMVPSAVAADPDLSPGAKLLFGVILSLARGSWGRCAARNEKLAEMTGLCVKQVLRLLRDLESRGLIRRALGGGRRSEIEVTWTPEQGQIVPPVLASEGMNCPASGDKTPMQVGQFVPPDEISEERDEREFAGGEDSLAPPETNPEILRGPWPATPPEPPRAPQAGPLPQQVGSPGPAQASPPVAGQPRPGQRYPHPPIRREPVMQNLNPPAAKPAGPDPSIPAAEARAVMLAAMAAARAEGV